MRRGLLMQSLVGFALYGLSGLFLFAYADFEAPPPPPPGIYAAHAGITLTGNETVQGDELSVRTSEWTLETPSWTWSLEEIDVPAERAIWMLYRGSLLESVFEGNPEEGENYALAQHALSGSATSTLTAQFDMPLLGDPETPSGRYTLVVAELPETYFIFDEDVGDYVGERPYTRQDFVNWVAGLDSFAQPNNRRSLEFDYVAGEAPSGTPDPVIIVPGILGSEQVDGEWVMDPILHTYDDLIATLDANGYTPDEDLFPFPYNWRKSNVETAVLLKEKIDEIKEICECDKVDIVAHSMGGLVARQYIQSHDYEDDVDQLIFLGTPHLGAPKAYLMWEGGEIAPTELSRPIEDILNKFSKFLLTHEAKEEGYPSLFAYLRTEPIESVRQLLPVYDYIFDSNTLRDYPSDYPTNPFLENLNANVDTLINSGVRLYNIIGDTLEQRTVVGINVVDPAPYLPLWANGYPDGFNDIFGDHGLVLGGGDQTVPLASANFITTNVISTTHTHGELAYIAEVQSHIYRFLKGQEPTSISQEIAGVDLVNLLFISMQSPADFLVIAPDGKKIGKDFNGQTINQIPYAFYTGFDTDTEFITILNPLDGEYKIFSQGIGSGPYTIETNLIDNATTTTASFKGSTAPGITSELNLEVQEGEVSPNALEPVVTYESTLADLERINKLKWINAGIYKSLKAQLQTAKKSKPFVAKILLQTMLRQLDMYRGKLITEHGYQVLAADIKKLIAN